MARPRACTSARSSSDVLIYAFPADEFAVLLDKYPAARRFVDVYGSVVADYERTDGRRDPQATFLHDVIASKPLHTCDETATIADVARTLAGGANAVAVTGADGRAHGLITATALLRWIADGAGSTASPVSTLEPGATPVTLRPDATVTEALLTMAGADARALAVTADGTPAGALLSVVTSRDLASVFGDHPVFILRDIRRAASIAALRDLNQRARGFALQQLTSAGAVEWISRFLHLADVAIVKRLITMNDADEPGACWCFAGAAGRAELLTRSKPSLVLLLPGDVQNTTRDAYRRVAYSLGACDYLPQAELPFDTTFHVAAVSDWQRRYEEWIRNPIVAQTYQARPLFDLQPIHGARELWRQLDVAVTEAVDDDFVRVLANDCLASLPPLTFYQNVVVDETGEESPIFRLEQSAVRPLVDVGRVFGFAARQVFGMSTLERFATASSLLPEHQAIFREAAETLRIVLWLQGRVGIAQGTDGAELPPSVVSRHERHLLKSGFRSIHRLLEFTAASTWLQTL